MSSWLATPVGGGRSEISAAGEEGSTGEPDTNTKGRTAESFGARRDLDDRGSLHTEPLLKIKKATLYRHTSQGTGPPFYKIGKHNRWKRSEVLAWFDSHSG